jgi:hypothetical protein
MQNRRIATFEQLAELVSLMSMVDAQSVLWCEGRDSGWTMISTMIGDGLLLQCKVSNADFGRWLKEDQSRDFTIFKGRVEFAP